MAMKHQFLAVAVFLGLNALAPSQTSDSMGAFEKHRTMNETSIFKNLQWQNIGPFFCGGRIVDIEVYENHPETFLVASASGGVWRTQDNGLTWAPIFEHESTSSIGDIAISQANENLIWVGTGESNSQSSSYPGTGVYRSLDKGKTWVHLGLADTHHIARVLVDPSNPQTVYVAALGHLYENNKERGVFKTSDNGRTWKNVLFISEKTGVVDLVMHPKDPRIIYAAAWQRERQKWNFIEGGLESAIYKTTDGGKTWSQCPNGIPQTRETGRIGLAISRSNPNLLYALLDNQSPKTEGQTAVGLGWSGLSIDQLADMTGPEFLKLDEEKLSRFLSENRAPSIYSARILKELVSSRDLTPQTIARMLFDANDRRLNPNIVGAEVYCSRDSGAHWEKMNQSYIGDMYYTYGFYFGQIRVSPEDENRLYVLGVSPFQSSDGGRTFRKLIPEQEPYANALVHCDSHAMWINPRDPRIILLGTDGGLNLSKDRGQNWQKFYNLPITQCYTIAHDSARPPNIYIGTQDNGVLATPYSANRDAYRHSWKMILGGDGAMVAPVSDSRSLIYAAAQFGSLFRVEIQNKKIIGIQPQSMEKFDPYRFNWLAPFLIPSYDPGVLLMGTNKVLQSTDQGATWSEISPDLTERKNMNGNVPYATLTALVESPHSPDVLYAGSDDGNVWLTRNHGKKWEKISLVLPKKWVTCLLASKFQAERIYVAMSGSRDEDTQAYVFASDNHGLDWEALKTDLPNQPVNVIAEDPEREEILYLGTDLGLYISLDQGGSWQSLQGNLPTVPVTDLKINPREGFIMIATHGRGVYILALREIYQSFKRLSGIP